MSDQPAKTAFNKENAPELLGQLVRVLKSQGMEESLQALKQCGLTKKLNDEWMDDTRNRQKRKRRASADVTPVRQRTQYTCMSTSLMMCLQALGHKVNEDEVNDVMGARPKKGAAWENAIAAAQHYGCRATLVSPSTVQQLKKWTDAGIPVMIAWNPEGRPWSHASVVFDVDDDLNVYVADPNIPDPDETVRIVPKAEFYSKWSEKWPDYIVRRPAMAVEREITPDGRQVMASTKTAEGADCWSDYKAGGLTYAELQECLKRFEDPYEAEGRNRHRPRIRPSGPVNKKQRDALNALLMKRPNDKFIKSLRDQVQRGRKLSEKQLKAVRQNLYRNRMRGEADLFRAARIQQQPLMTMPDYGMSMEERWERGFQEPKTAANWDLWAEASKLALAMVYDGAWGGKDASLVWDAVVHAPRDNAEATQEPERWARLVQKHKSTMSKIPGRVGVKFNDNGMVFPAKGTDKRTMQWINDNFQFLGPFITGKLDKAKAKRERLELQKKHVALLSDLFDSFLEKRPNRFIQSLRDQLTRRGSLSEKQLEAAWKILQDEPNGTDIVNDFETYQSKGWDITRQRRYANDTDSGAGSDEDKFYKDPEKREVLEFARSKAISNSVEVAIDHAKELDIPLKQELKDVAKAPPLPTEIVDEPGGKALSTLNRYVIKTEDPAAEPAVKMNKDRMAFWKAELE